jgi:transcriptional regulator with XRE-family HTH domain
MLIGMSSETGLITGAEESFTLGAMVRKARLGRGWSQKQCADAVGLSRDSISLIERDAYALPTAPGTGRVIERLTGWLGLDLGEVLRASFTAKEIAASAYARFAVAPKAAMGVTAIETLEEYHTSLPTTPEALLARAAMHEARGMLFLIALERAFGAVEYLITNEPSYMLFADIEYVRGDSPVRSLASQEDRDTYLTQFDLHQRRMRDAVQEGTKQYRVVMQRAGLSRFLERWKPPRARYIVEDMCDLLRHDGLGIVFVDETKPFEEFEVLSDRQSHERGGRKVSVRHRRVLVGEDKDKVYELALVGTAGRLVEQDWERAKRFWERGQAQAARASAEAKSYMEGRYRDQVKSVAAWTLHNTLRQTHPSA